MIDSVWLRLDEDKKKLVPAEIGVSETI